MIGLDTNILVRYIVEDDPVQLRKATECIEQHLTDRNYGFISTVVIAEMAWVLESVYGFTHTEIAAAIERILQLELLVVEHEAEVFLAMVALKRKHGAFADALIGGINAQAGCSRTVTFNRKALRLPGFDLL
jgi:predicted nucleic-acid-binding protein